MNDCQNAEIRDQLPDLLHDRLDAARRAEVMAHVASCVDCRDEVELLRAARAMFEARTPRVDVRYVVNALPLAKPRPVRIGRDRPRWTDWRIAAAVTLLVAGGSSLAVLNRDRRNPVSVRDTLQAPPIAATAVRGDSTSANQQVQSSPTSAPSIELTRPTMVADEQNPGLGSSRLGDLTERQLETLLTEIDQLQATPITEPEPVSIKVGETSGAPEGA